MIETGQQLVDTYANAFAAEGGDPDQCEGVIWARSALSADERVTAGAIIEAIGRKIDDGTANHGWLLGVLRLLWSDLGHDHRCGIIALLIKGGAHKGLMDAKLFSAPFTDREKSMLRDAFERSGAYAALRRLNG